MSGNEARAIRAGGPRSNFRLSPCVSFRDFRKAEFSMTNLMTNAVSSGFWVDKHPL